MNSNEQYYIIRTEKAGVFFAKIAERRGQEVDLLNARRIHYWTGATECIGISQNGVKKGSRLTVPIDSMTILGVIELLPCSDDATRNLLEMPAWTA